VGNWIHLRKCLLPAELTATAKSARALLTAISLINMRALGCRIAVDTDGTAYILADVSGDCSDADYVITIMRQIANVYNLVVAPLTGILQSGDIMEEPDVDDIFGALRLHVK